jgi:hypothetical protein
MATEQIIPVDAIPYIAPEAIERQYQAILRSPDAETYQNVVRMVRWAEACVRVGMRERDERIASLEKTLRTIAHYADTEPE